MTTIAALGIKVSTDGVAQSERELDKLDKTSQRTAKSASAMSGAWKAAVGILSAATIARVTSSLIHQADAWSNINARIGLVTKSTKELTQAQTQIFAISQRTGASLDTTADLYVKLAQSSDHLRENQSELLRVTELVNKSLVVSGASASSAEAVVRQFSQALASGTLRGDEFVSVMEGAPRLARAIADGLDVPIGKLRDLAAQGQLTADKVTGALLKSGKDIDSEFSKLPMTVSRAVTQVENAILQLVGKTDDASQASKDLAKAIGGLANVLSSPSTVQAFQNTAAAIANIASEAVNAASKLGLLNQVRQIGSGKVGLADATNDALKERRKQLQANIDLGKQWRQSEGNIVERLFGGRDTTAYDSMVDEVKRIDAIIATRERGANTQGNGRRYVPSGAAAVAIAAAAEPPAAKKVAATARTRDTTVEDALREAQRLAAAQDDWRNQALDLAADLQGPVAQANRDYEKQLGQLERAFQSGEVTLSDYAKVQDLLAQSRDKEVAAIEARANPQRQLMSDLQFELDLMAKTNAERAAAIQMRDWDAQSIAKYGDQVVAANRQIESSMETVSAMDDIRHGFGDAFADIVSGSASAKDAVLDFLDSINKRALQKIGDNIADSIFGASGTDGTGSSGNGFSNFVSQIVGAIWGGGRASGGPMQAGKLYEVGEKRPEVFESNGRLWMVPSRNGYMHPDVSGARGGGSWSVNQQILVQGVPDKRTASQIAIQTGREMQRARGRNG